MMHPALKALVEKSASEINTGRPSVDKWYIQGYLAGAEAIYDHMQIVAARAAIQAEQLMESQSISKHFLVKTEKLK